MLKKVEVWPRTLSDAIYNTSLNIHHGVLDELVNKNIQKPPFILRPAILRDLIPYVKKVSISGTKISSDKLMNLLAPSASNYVVNYVYNNTTCI